MKKLEKDPERASGKKIRRLFKTVFFILICGGIPLLPGCVVEKAAGIGAYVENGYLLKELEMENARFEPVGLPFPIHPAHNYWLRRGEGLEPRWDTFEIHWQKEKEMCGFSDNISTDKCQICNFCSPMPINGGSQCGSLFVFPGIPEIVLEPGFVPTEQPESIRGYRFVSEIAASCTNNPTSLMPIFFVPEESGFYRLRKFDGITYPGEFGGEAAIQIVEDDPGMTRSAAFELTARNVDGTNYWAWNTPGSVIWGVNFSSRLKVAEVRVLKGVCGEPSGGQACSVPADAEEVKPSRLLFLPGFLGTVSGHPGEAAHRCYGASGGVSINIENCTERYNAAQTNPKFVTPTYEFIPQNETEKLTWFIEFNTNEGADADLRAPGNQPMAAGEKLIIEFTIKAN
ncbi:MAG: hypothetical protein R2747_17060 [Pyrinomonadaceae bacterium]